MTEQKIEAFWRYATAADIAKVMKGETIEARFRDSALRDWKFGHLNGWADGEFRCDLANCWVHCQVYDPPEWYTNKPDPGEGWRLLEKFPDELKLATDEGWFPDGAKWCPVESDNGIQLEGYWYRRRIEHPTPSNCVAYETQVDEVIQLPNGKRFKVTKEGFEVL
jgi:hypothetical protein